MSDAIQDVAYANLLNEQAKTEADLRSARRKTEQARAIGEAARAVRELNEAARLGGPRYTVDLETGDIRRATT